MQKKVIFIAGMHRSGTSMITRLLNLHGAHIPIEIEYKDKYNLKGYWESFEYQGLNDRLLQLGDSHWSDVRPFNFKLFADRETVAFDKDAEAFVRKALSTDKEIIAIKDPRICRVIPVWASHFERQGAKVCALIPFRHPLQVAASINGRDGFEIEYGLRMWMRNVLDAEACTREMTRSFCSYDEALNDWPSCFERIAVSLGISSLRGYEEVRSEVDLFVERSLAHWSLGNDELALIEGPAGPVRQAFDLLQRLVAAEKPAVLSRLTTLRNQINHNRSVDEILRMKKRECGQIPGTLDMRLENLETQQQQVLDLLTENQDAAERKNRQVIEISSELAHARAKAEQEASVRRQLESKLKEVQATTARQFSTIRRFEAVIGYVRNNFADLIKRSERVEQQLRGSLNELNRQLDEKNSRVQDLEAQVSDMHRGMIELSDAYLDIRRSLSWRLSWPLRFVGSALIVAPLRAVSGAFKAAMNMLRPADHISNGVIASASPEIGNEQMQLHLSGSCEPAEQPSACYPSSGEPFPLIQSEIAGRQFVPLIDEEPEGPLPVNLIAFYLPQFHAIPENDEWWGQGFTEWTNVRPMTPKFLGHYQPKVPGELGYYDLTDINVQRRQVELARLYGIGGFCFYFYWFRGKRLLEAPTLQYLENPDLNLPFCLCWANENWTRAWDGQDQHVLLGQEHSPKDDFEFIEYVSRYLRDSRYIRVAGKPLLIVYRPALLPEPQKTAERWRQWCRDNGIGEIFLAYTTSFEVVDPASYGFDAAVEFPPNNTDPAIVTGQVATIDPQFKGFVYDWTSVANRSLRVGPSDYATFRGVTPGWDNVARRPETGAIFVGTTPERYEHWLRRAIADTVLRFDQPSERLVFINAWNEWAEGAYLEPDAVYGYAYLDATRKALTCFPVFDPAEIPAKKIFSNKKTIALVIHDAHAHGSQYLTLYLAQSLRRDFGFHVELIIFDGGVLEEEYKKWATVHNLRGEHPLGENARRLAKSLADRGLTSTIANTTVSGLFLQTLTEAGIDCISLVHELPEIIRSYKLEQHAKAIAAHARKVLFAVPQVAAEFSQFAAIPDERIVIRPQGLYKKNPLAGDIDKARIELRKELGLEQNARIILGVGFLDRRKGVDLFVKAAFQVLEKEEDVYFVWVGHWNAEMQREVEALLENSPHARGIIFTGHRRDTDLFYAGSDVFALTSREDPFPSTVMEALEVGVPVVAFEGAGGAETLLRRGCGLLAQFEDVADLADKLMTLLEKPDLASRMGKAGAEIVRLELSHRHYVYDLLELVGMPQPKVSVIVPNYNYAHYLEQRLRSICDQDLPVFEIIFLDDASTDDSVGVAKAFLETCSIDHRIVVNDSNSGSVFSQWRKGVELARGDLVWICEADDLAEPGLLSSLLDYFTDDNVVLAYCQSRQIDENGTTLATDYLQYTDDISTEHWRNDFLAEGSDEIRNCLAVKNCIPNASAVLFRKADLAASLERCWSKLETLRVAGDWLIYMDLLKHGKVGFKARSFNAHRRHKRSVTIDRQNNEKHFSEIKYLQNLIASEFELDESTRRKARAFADHARSWLGLEEPKVESISEETVSPDSGLLSSVERQPPPESMQARAIAFYLPQFHPIKENNEWWGNGFTEWTNVTRAQPQFPGHYQPHLPADLGFYDLRLPETRRAQAKLARRNGIEGFCYWHYWFNGRRLLEKPFNEVLQSGEPDFPFCLAWANESWSRRWLGDEKDILMAQVYSREDDELHIKWLIQAFSDSRYLTVDGRPIFLIYRPSDLPEPQRTTELFRERCLASGVSNPYLIGVNGHEVRQDTKALGFDATLHFTPQLGILPNAFTDGPLAERAAHNRKLGIDSDVTKIFDYADSLGKMLNMRKELGYETIPSIFAGWDNSPRRGENAIVMINNDAEAYGGALKTLVSEVTARPNEHRLIFLNAWNEWAEGNHLEPDQRNGHLFLEQTREALVGFAEISGSRENERSEHVESKKKEHP